MTSIQEKLKRNNPSYSDRIDRMFPIVKKIADSKDPFESMSEIVPTLDAVDAYVLGMITWEFVQDGTICIRGDETLSEEYKNDKER